MKILITRSSENQTIGGAELSARDQAIALRQLDHTPVLSSNVRAIRDQLSAKSIKTYPNLYLQRFKPPLRYLYFWGLLPIKLVCDALLVLLVRPDVINPHSREDQISFTLSRWLHRRPVVWKDPGDMAFILSLRHGLAGSLYKNLYLSAAKKADHIYLLNDSHVEQLSKVLGETSRSKLSAVASSIIYNDYSPVFKSDNSTITFGSVCRLSPEKDIDTLIKAYLSIAHQINSSRLIIVGDGPERAKLEKYAADDPRIEFRGQIDDVSIPLNEIDIFVHPAKHEGWGRNIKEAMYFGKAVIGSNTGGIARQVNDGQTGLLFEPGSANQLAEKMLYLANNADERRRLAQTAQQKALEDGDFIRIVEQQILPIYVSAVADRSMK